MVQVIALGGITSAVKSPDAKTAPSYLRAGDYRMGFLLNFNTVHMRDGIKRIVNRL